MKNRYPLKIEAFQLYNGKMWFVSGNFLCSKDIDSGIIELETYVIPRHEVQQDFLATLSVRYKSRMICIPELADRIVDYDVNSKKRKEIILSNIQCDNSIKFRSACIFNNKIYIMPQSAHHILVYDPESQEIEYLSEWFIILREKHGSLIEEKENLFGLSRLVGGKIYFSTTFSNELCCFNPQNGDFNCFNIGSDNYRYQVFSYFGGVFFLIDNINQRIVRWMEDGGIIGQMEGIPFSVKIQENAESYEAEYRFFDAFILGESIYLPACFALESLVIDPKTGRVNKCELLKNVHGCCFACQEKENEVVFSSALESQLYIINQDSGFKKLEMELQEDEGVVSFTCAFDILNSLGIENEREIWYESPNVLLGGFIRYIR